MTLGSSCICQPVGSASCGAAAMPMCTGTCPSGQTCQVILGSCSCGAPPPPPPPTCGNGSCQASENCSTCSSDCTCLTGQICNAGICQSTCGDGTCTLAEKCSCLVDCSGQSCGTGNGRICSAGSCICPGGAVEMASIHCADGLDNDCDGLTDCADADCAPAASCSTAPETQCDDGADNDSDGPTDCADGDCVGRMCRRSATPGDLGMCSSFGGNCCTTYESMTFNNQCGNGQDDDCDGQSDCNDSNCLGSVACCHTAGQSCMIPSDCCAGPIGSRTCSAIVPPALVPPVAPVIPVLPTIPTAPVAPAPVVPLVPPSLVPPVAPVVRAPVVAPVPSVPAGIVPTALPAPVAIPSFCSSPMGCHLGFSAGVCSYLPSSVAGEPSTCPTPGQLRPEVPPSVPTPTPFFIPAYTPPACPYTTGCHTECILGRVRLRPGSEDGIGDTEVVGSDCESPPDAPRPSLFDRMVSGVRRLFYKPL
jgi:hypothetical protein